MLTVKICKANGDEAVFEATDVAKESQGLLIQREGSTEFYGPGGQGYSLDWDGREKPEQLQSAQASATAYVMNRHGATVATYRL